MKNMQRIFSTLRYVCRHTAAEWRNRMKRVISILAALGITAGGLNVPAFAESFDVAKVNYIYTTGMQAVVSDAKKLSECTLLKNGLGIEDNKVSFTVDDNTVTLTFENKLLPDTVYSVVFKSTDGNEITKSFRMNKVFYEDFQGDEFEISDSEIPSGTVSSPAEVGTGMKYISHSAGANKYRIMEDNGNKYFLVSGGRSSAAGLYINNTADNEYTTVEYDLTLKHPFNYDSSDKYGWNEGAQPPMGVQFRTQLDNLETSNKYIGLSSLWSYDDKSGVRKYKFMGSSMQKGALGFNMTSDGTMTIERYKTAAKNVKYSDIKNDFEQTEGKEGSLYSTVDEKSAMNWGAGEYHFAASYVNSTAAVRIDTPLDESCGFVSETGSDDYVEPTGYAAINVCGRYVPAAGKLGTAVDNIFVYNLEKVDLEQIMEESIREFELKAKTISENATLLDEENITEAQKILDRIPENYRAKINKSVKTKFDNALKELEKIKADSEKSGIKLYEESTSAVNKGKFIVLDETISSAAINFTVVDNYQYFPELKLLYIPGEFFKSEGKTLIVVNNHQLVITVGGKDTDRGTVLECSDENVSVKDFDIEGITYGTYADFIKLITVPFDCKIICEKPNEIIPSDGSGKIRVEKIFDNSEYSIYNLHIGNYINIKYKDGKHIFDFDGTKLTKVPFGMSVDDFFDAIVVSDTVEMKLFEGETEKTEGTVKDGDSLKLFVDNKAAAEYPISVIPASSDNSFKYKGKLNPTSVSGVKYLSKFDDFVADITDVAEFAAAEYPYNAGDLIKNDFVFYIIAQNGDKRAVKVTVEAEDTQKSTKLSSSVYTVRNNVISKIKTGITVGDMKNNLVSDGIIKVYNSNMEEIKNGVLSGGETVRVYAKYDRIGYEVYTIAYDDNTEEYKADIININSDKCEMSDGYKAYDDGYEASMDNTCTLTFKSDPFKEAKEIIIKASSKHDFTAMYARLFKASIYKNDKLVEERKDLGGEKNADYIWNDITKINVKPGDVVKVVLTTNTFTVYKDLAFFDKGDAEIVSIMPKNSTNLKEFAADDSIVITFKKDMDESTLNKDNIRLISKNGYEVPYTGTYSSEEKTYTVLPDYPLAGSEEYYIFCNKSCATKDGYNISRIYSEYIKTTGDKIHVQLLYKDANGKYISGINGAKTVSVLTDGAIGTKKLFMAVYKNGLMNEFKQVQSDTECDFSQELTNGNVTKLFVFDENDNFCYLPDID